jgi:hypothetical protein
MNSYPAYKATNLLNFKILFQHLWYKNLTDSRDRNLTYKRYFKDLKFKLTLK